MSPSSVLLAIDVGNTATNFGIFSAAPRRTPPRPWRIDTLATQIIRNPNLFKREFLQPYVRLLRGKSCAGIAVSSVVPSLNNTLRRLLWGFLKISPLFISARTAPRVKILYRHPEEVGADRIVNARAVREITRRPCVVVDFGTSTTFDCVDGEGAFLGGVITPGPVISAQALYERTAQLPKIILEKPAHILGRSTLECIQSGLYHGYRGLVKEIVAQLKKELGPRTLILATGGQAQWIVKGLDIIDKNIPNLTLMGLTYLWHDWRAGRNITGRKIQ